MNPDLWKSTTHEQREIMRDCMALLTEFGVQSLGELPLFIREHIRKRMVNAGMLA